MPVAARQSYPTPDYWALYGHSWFNGSTGPLDQTGRVDALLRSELDVEYSNWLNVAVAGARITGENRSSGGWAAMYDYRVPPVRTAQPLAPDAGGGIFGWGINDLGAFGGTAQIRQAMIYGYTAAISRYRASTIWENDNATYWSYGAGFSNFPTGADVSSGGTAHLASSTTNANATLTLPAYYQGEPICIALIGQPGVTGANFTFSGTAGVTGTLSTSNIMPSASLGRCPVVRRITNLTSSNAGQTIVLTVSSIDASGSAFIDCAWVESFDPPPVLIQGVARLTAAGYANGLYVNWTGTQAQKDQDVLNVNSDIQGVVAQFDGMVQYVDVDSALLSSPGGAGVGVVDATLTVDGIHPNERGAGKIVDKYFGAIKLLTPGPRSTSNALEFNNPSRRAGLVRQPERSQAWRTAEAAISGTGYTAAAGEMFAIPFQISEARNTYDRIQLEVTAHTSGTTTIRYGYYDDILLRGYPQRLPPAGEATSGGALSITSTGLKNSTVSYLPDPGTYWLVIKIETIGVGTVLRAVQGPCRTMPTNLDSTGGGTLQPVGWKLTGQPTGAFPGQFATGATLTATAPMISLRKV